MNRRTYVLAAGSGVSALLAGCLDDASDDESDGAGDDESDDNSDGNDDDDDHGAVEAAEAYAAATADEDLDAMADAMHSAHPFNPENLEDEETDEVTFDVDGIESYDVELADDEFETDDIAELPQIDFWFEDDELTEVIEGEAAALVSMETEYTEAGETVTEETRLVTLTDDGEWAVFFEYEEPPEIPAGDPIDDESYRVVDDLVFDEEMEVVTIELEDSIEVDIDEMVAYSESLEQDSSIWQAEPTDGFPFTSFSSPFDPDGDTIVVTAIEDDEEIVVHREAYEP